MGSADNFCLRWNDFEANVSGSFRELRDEADFFDVTLSCDGAPLGRTLQAHKVILSACSGFFKRCLREQMAAATSTGGNSAIPYIYLRGVKWTDLESILDFMYHGEVNVSQDQLQTFLKVAEDLQIKGLTKGDKAQQASSTPLLPRLPTKPLPLKNAIKSRKIPPNTSLLTSNNPPASTSGATPSKRPRISETESQDDEEVADDITVKNELIGESGLDSIAEPPSVDDLAASFEDGHGLGGAEAFAEATYGEDESFDGMEGESNDGMTGTFEADGLIDTGGDTNRDHSELIYSYIEPAGDNRWRCKTCGQICTRKSDVRRHIETKHIRLPGHYRCIFCPEKFDTKRHLQRHIIKTHRN